jgi:hypothetical protein
LTAIDGHGDEQEAGGDGGERAGDRDDLVGAMAR